jgi:hypothetical protein
MAAIIRASLNLDDLDSLRDFVLKAAVVDGPPVVHAIVALHWPELLHKVKPPAAKMH